MLGVGVPILNMMILMMMMIIIIIGHEKLDMS